MAISRKTTRRVLFVLFGVLVLALVTWLAIRPREATLTVEDVSGTDPVLTTPREETIPMMNVAEAIGWEDGEMPTPAEGLEVNEFAGDLDHPRWMLTLDNGDVLVAETNSPPRDYSGIRGWFERRLMTRGGSAGDSPNRITLLRDVDSDGTADQRRALLTEENGLNSPFGMAVVDGFLYVANTDALIRFPFEPGQIEIEGTGEKIVDLPANAPNSHWTKSLVVDPDDPNLFYVGVGSNSNIGENGMEIEENRAAVLQVNVEERETLIYTAGMRNPVGLDFEPNSGRLYAVVNERDMMGGDLVPDYLSVVDFGAHYGWPGVYWGRYLDERVEPMTPRMAQYSRVPEYALGPHTASLGLEFSENARLGEPFTGGAFIGQHGSWNRRPMSGYKVVFVAFENGRPAGAMIDVLTGFLNDDNQARGRPVGVMTDAAGALLVADDVGNRIWRVSNPRLARRPSTAR